MKEGNVQLLGLLSYGIPIVSTLILIIFNQAELTYNVGMATLFIFLCSIVAVKKS